MPVLPLAASRLGATLLAAALLATPVLGTGTAAAESATDDPAIAAEHGADWLAEQVNAAGFVAGEGGAPDYGTTVAAGLALAAAGIDGGTFSAVVTYMQSHVDDYVKTPSGDRPGALGRLAMLADAAGINPEGFGGQPLITRLLATARTSGDDAGLLVDPQYNGAFNHSLGLLGLATATSLTPAQEATAVAAVEWLVRAQCADGGWQNDLRTVTGGTLAPCNPTNPQAFSGEDTNTSAFATQALAAVDADITTDPLPFFDAAQNDQGGFGYFADQATDANSTGVVVQAILAAGEDPRTGRWVKSGRSAVQALLALQLGCESATADRGAWAYQPDQDGVLKPNAFATVDAVPGAAGTPFPLGQASFGPTESEPDCSPVPPPLPKPDPTGEPFPDPDPTSNPISEVTTVAAPPTAPRPAPSRAFVAGEVLVGTGPRGIGVGTQAMAAVGLLAYGGLALLGAQALRRRAS